MRRQRATMALLQAGSWFLATSAFGEPGSQTAAPAAASKPLVWHADLGRARAEAKERSRGILVRFEAGWCGWCRKLEAELAQPAAQKELARWTLAALDLDRAPDESRALAVHAVPALRILSAGGNLIASHDGYLPAAELVDWLEKQREAAAAKPTGDLAGSAKPSATVLVRLLRELDAREPVRREAAIARLVPFPNVAAGAIVRVFAGQTGARPASLQSRLAALEILREWSAPVSAIDPWQPHTLTADRLDALREWAGRADKAAPPPSLAPAELPQEIAGYLRASPEGAEAIRERLARHREALLPLVKNTLRETSGDQARQRLVTLAYRLVASHTLVLTWPGGLERLAELDPQTRHRAAEELLARAGPEDESLFVELFGDPDPLVREIALRGLRNLGGEKVSGALVKLLEDPEPNVRAAVLKQLAESPAQSLVPSVAQYVSREKDPDLLVHAVRFLRAAKGKGALECLQSLLQHESWQVRAEAAEAVGQCVQYLPDDQQKADGYVALIDLLDDPDGFVVSRALAGLARADVVAAVEPLVAVIGRHPPLAVSAVELLAQGEKMRPKAVPHLRTFCRHEAPAVRAAAIGGLCEAAPDAVEAELLAALKDKAAPVRLAAAKALLQILESNRAALLPEVDGHGLPWGTVAPITTSTTPRPTFFENVVGLLAGGTRRPTPSQGTNGNQVAAAGAKPPDVKRAKSKGTAAPPPPDLPPAEPNIANPTLGSRYDVALVEFRAGKDRPEWMAKMAAPAQAMRASTAAEERLWACLVLIALGKVSESLPVLIETVSSTPALLEEAAQVLPWLAWQERRESFDRLLEIGSQQPQDLTVIVRQMGSVSDPRAAAPLWALLGGQREMADLAPAVLGALRSVHLGREYPSISEIPKSQLKEAARIAAPKAADGPEWQRVVALALLLNASNEDAETAARRIFAEPTTAPPLRQDSLRILLISQAEGEGQRTAAAALSHEDAEIRKIGLAFLALGNESIPYLRGSMYLMYEGQGVVRHSSAEAAAIDPPQGVTVPMLRPFLEDADPDRAAYAGYLLARLGDAAGMDRLLARWRKEPRDESLRKMVYRAIAALDDESYAPVLAEIYGQHEREAAKYSEFWIRDFYWTIRSMEAPAILELRQRIRDEVGMDRLR